MVTGRDKTETYLNGVRVEEVESFQYLGAIVSKQGSSITNIHIRIATKTAAKGKLDIVCCSHTITYNEVQSLEISSGIGIEKSRNLRTSV